MNAVEVPLLQDEEIRKINILVLQESGRSLFAAEPYNTGSNKFHPMHSSDQATRTCIYINKILELKFY